MCIQTSGTLRCRQDGCDDDDEIITDILEKSSKNNPIPVNGLRETEAASSSLQGEASVCTVQPFPHPECIRQPRHKTLRQHGALI